MNTPKFYLFGIKAPQKYATLFNELVRRPDVQVCTYITAKGSTIPNSLKVPFKKQVARFESWYTLRKNGYSSNDILTISNSSKISSEDVVLAFIHTRGGADWFNATQKSFLLLNQYWCHSIEMLNDILPFYRNYILEANTAKCGNYLLEANIPKNYNFHILPFIVAERFSVKKSFMERKKLAVATGTVAKCLEENDFSRHYGSPYFHKMRKVIYENKETLKGFVDVLISPYIERDEKKIKKRHKGIANTLYSLYQLTFLKPGSQKNYFSFDIVEKYNEYQMAIVPEEIVGIPAIGAFESMACGCAFIGIDHVMYRDMGMIPGVNYIAYDNTIEGLKKVILYYQSHQKELSEIAEKGREFVRNNNNKDVIYTRFLSLISEK